MTGWALVKGRDPFNLMRVSAIVFQLSRLCEALAAVSAACCSFSSVTPCVAIANLHKTRVVNLTPTKCAGGVLVLGVKSHCTPTEAQRVSCPKTKSADQGDLILVVSNALPSG
eukprot:TRINITY_DN1301_c0_g1_i5.p1 TRINITY_DN1301_c0_g1~~TRINITY_DN1301_c0_g1_i5.p1  ORF type:complete len:113 (-),score=1.18 TRINITY_DN1301_c0_g1_i5:21-359(-)